LYRNFPIKNSTLSDSGDGRDEDFPDGPERGSAWVADLPTGTVSGGQPLRTGQSKTANRDERESDVRRVGAPPSC
jgi:hypothetical protein